MSTFAILRFIKRKSIIFWFIKTHRNKVKQMKDPKKMKQVPCLKIKIKTKMHLILNNKDICKRDYKIKVILKLYSRQVKT